MTPEELRDGWRTGKHFGTANELCPFCGHEALIKPFRLDGKIAWYYAECQGCGIQGFDSKNPRDAGESWDELAKRNFAMPFTPSLKDKVTREEQMAILMQQPIVKRDTRV